MRGANSYEPLNQTHDQVATEIESGSAEPNEAGIDRQSDIERALALEPEPEPTPEPAQLDDYVAPEQWTSSAGMAQQQASALDWLEHSNEVRQERASIDYEHAANELSGEDRELLEAARATEAEVQRQQELGQSHFPEPSGP